MSDKEKPPGRPKGHAVRWTPDALLRLSTVTAEDAAAAKALFRRLAPKKINRLLG